MGVGSYGNLIEQIIGQMPPTLQNVPGGGPPGVPPPGGTAWGLPSDSSQPAAPASFDPFLMPIQAANPFVRRGDSMPMPTQNPFARRGMPY